MTYEVGDSVWVQSKQTEDKYPAVIETVEEDGFTVLWLETDQHVHVPIYAVVGIREVDADE